MTLAEAKLVLESAGVEFVSMRALAQRLAPLGYRLNRARDCRSTARYLTGPNAGRSYPCCTTGISESDTGMSFAHYQARRDSNFQALQALRGTIASISRGAIFEL